MAYNTSPIKVISLLFLSISLLFVGVYSFVSGDGSAGDPFIVNNCVDLDNISNYLSSNFTQGSNIDCSIYNSGSGFDPIGGIFTGSYDGNGSTISNLFINRPSSDYVGLFSRVNGATITNVSLIDINITGYDRVGGLVGSSSFSSSVINSYSSGSVVGNALVGGLIGFSYSSSVTNSYSSSSVVGNNVVGGLVSSSTSSSVTNSYSSGSVEGSNSVGGLVGSSYSSSVINSYSSSSVVGNDVVGGLVGSSYSSSFVSNSYSSGSVEGNSSVGGLVGNNLYNSNISNSFTLSDVSGNTNVGSLVGLNDEGVGSFANVTNSFWLNTSGNPSIGIGNDSYGGQIATPQTDISYFYDISNPPFAGNWDGGAWNFTGTNFPFLVGQDNPFSVVSSSGVSSLFPLGSIFIPLFLVLGFLFLN